MCVCILRQDHVQAHTYIHTYIHSTYECMYVCMHTSLLLNVCCMEVLTVCVYVYCDQNHVCMYVHMYVCMYIYVAADDLASGLKAEEVILKRYHEQLSVHLKEMYGVEAAEDFPPWLLLQQFELAMLDLVRFFAGKLNHSCT